MSYRYQIAQTISKMVRDLGHDPATYCPWLDDLTLEELDEYYYEVLPKWEAKHGNHRL